MKKRIFTLAGIAMVGCRAVLGIEDLPGDGGASSSSSSSGGNGGGDSGGKDTGPSGSDAGGGGDAACGSLSDNDCIKCCRDRYKGNPNFDGVIRTSQCICGGASPCASSCKEFCDGGDPMTFGMTCFGCADPQFLQNTADCPQTLDNLAKEADLGVCFKSCKQ